jgi:HAD superfamily hydrolase (TIGR01549 family)
LSAFVPTRNLSRNWDSYKSRNDDDIIDEILQCAGKPKALKQEVKNAYLALLARRFAENELSAEIIPGANQMLKQLAAQGVGLGIATANLLQAARIRLVHAGLWQHVAQFPFGADGGGHKRRTLARAIAATGLARDRIVYVGDNLNDVDAGLANGVHFIGFSTNAARRDRLKMGGAQYLSADHHDTARLIMELLHA